MLRTRVDNARQVIHQRRAILAVRDRLVDAPVVARGRRARDGRVGDLTSEARE